MNVGNLDGWVGAAIALLGTGIAAYFAWLARQSADIANAISSRLEAEAIKANELQQKQFEYQQAQDKPNLKLCGHIETEHSYRPPRMLVVCEITNRGKPVRLHKVEAVSYTQDQFGSVAQRRHELALVRKGISITSVGGYLLEHGAKCEAVTNAVEPSTKLGQQLLAARTIILVTECEASFSGAIKPLGVSDTQPASSAPEP